MIKKPVPKKEVGIKYVWESVRIIVVQATNDALVDFRDFGSLLYTDDSIWVCVDSRFDFDEVLEYIENYG